MVVGTGNILTPALNKQLVALQQTARSVDATEIKLATGNRVNSPLDNPQNFFDSLSLSRQASDLSRLLDGIAQAIRTVQIAQNGLDNVSKIIDQAEFVTREAKSTLLAEQQKMSDIILEDDPIVYFEFAETSGAIVNNSGTQSGVILGQYFGPTLDAGELHFAEDSRSISFDGVSDYINIPNNNLINTDPAGYPQRSVELTFNADTTAGRQVLYKAGGTGNAMSIYIDDGRVYFVARDSGDFGPFNISAEIDANTTYHAAFVFDFSTLTFTGYLNGDVVGIGAVTKEMNRHGGAISLGRSSGGSFYHDGPGAGTNNYYTGKMADFAIYNTALTQDDIRARYEATQLDKAKEYQDQITEILSQVDGVATDSSFRGINLLDNDNITTYFNRDGSSSLTIQGEDFSFSGLGIESPDFKLLDDVDSLISDFENASDKFKAFENSLSVKLNIIQDRRDYTEKTINTLKAGSTDLIAADQDEEGAHMLALATRRSIQLETFSLSAKGASGIADLLSQSSIGGALNGQ
ncbi:MAG TPA: hypothetical protein PK690_13615 [Emcibacteraceae bacterium]|nr:hypothetical protein [Emcibacteraceae bacterium]